MFINTLMQSLILKQLPKYGSILNYHRLSQSSHKGPFNAYETLSPLQSYFHDGSILDIKHQASNLYILMESAEVDPDMVFLPLSKENYLKGILSFKNINKLTIDAKPIQSTLFMKGDWAEIYTLEVHKNSIKIWIDWMSELDLEAQQNISELNIDANCIQWELAPDKNAIDCIVE